MKYASGHQIDTDLLEWMSHAIDWLTLNASYIYDPACSKPWRWHLLFQSKSNDQSRVCLFYLRSLRFVIAPLPFGIVALAVKEH